jgi:hypothetical protein
VARYAAATEVSVEKSKAEIERTLTRYGASAFGYATEDRRSLVQFKAHSRFVRFILPLPDPQEERFQYFMRNGRNTYRERSDSSKAEAYEQGCRQTWRALALVVKAKREARSRRGRYRDVRRRVPRAHRTSERRDRQCDGSAEDRRGVSIRSDADVVAGATGAEQRMTRRLQCQQVGTDLKGV